MDKVYDVAVVGAGVVGSAIARALSQYDLNCVLVEAGDDVGVGTSKANTAIWHTGFDAKPNTLEARLLRRSYELYQDYMPQAGIPFEEIGGLLVAWTAEQYEELPHLLERAHHNGDTDAHLISADEIVAREPHLQSGAMGGLFVPGEGILCTFSIPLALATQAVRNGVTSRLNFPVQTIEESKNGVIYLHNSSGNIACHYLVNAAGLYADELNRQLGHNEFTVTPRRGELIVFDKLARSLVNHIILPVPTSITKGVLISPTVYGNVLLGPTAEDLLDKSNTRTSEVGLSMLMDKGEAILPALVQEEVVATYAGLRAATEHADYQIHLHADQHYICVGGIRSTGVSACLGIAEYVLELLDDAGLSLNAKANFESVKMPYIGQIASRPFQSDDLIQQNPDYGEIVCHCEQVSRGEIVDALQSDIPARSLDGLRRRTRALQGRCQGFNCQARLVDLMVKEAGLNPYSLMGLETVNAS